MDDLSRYLIPSARHAQLRWLLAAALIAAGSWGAIEVYRRHELLLLEQATLMELRRASRVIPPPKPTPADQQTQRHWIALQRERDFSWYPLFAALERNSSAEIALLELLPDKSTGAVTLKGNARDMHAMTAYLDVLDHDAAFREVYLSHQKKIQMGALSVWSFEVRLKLH